MLEAKDLEDVNDESAPVETMLKRARTKMIKRAEYFVRKQGVVSSFDIYDEVKGWKEGYI